MVQNLKKKNKTMSSIPLTIGLRKSYTWTGNINNGALVLWDLDQGSWSYNRMLLWIENIEKIIYDKYKISDIHYYGALNCNVAGRKNWHNTFSQNVDECIYNDSPWGNIKSCLDVVPCIKQAVDKKLISICEDVINNNSDPSLIVIITNDSDFIPILKKSRENGINNMLIKWRNKMNEKDIKLINEADLTILVDKKNGSILKASSPIC